MLSWIRRRRRQRLLGQSKFTDAQWGAAAAGLPLLHRLSVDEQRSLRDLATEFLHTKKLYGVGGLHLTTAMQMTIALQACLPILHLGIAWYDDWVSVLVYPDQFVVSHTWQDDDGIVHQGEGPLSGEAWELGPVILSWRDICDADDLHGFNLVIHEFAHKLDMRNGGANGFPPLHRDMNAAEWTRVFNSAYQDLRSDLSADVQTVLDDYAAESPAEFFAVTSEVFFEKPESLYHRYPSVYEQMVLFYRQDPGQIRSSQPGS